MTRLLFRPIATLALLAAATVAGPVMAQPQTYPTKPIRLVVPFSAGSATDILARIVGTKMGETGHWQVVVDNRPGAGGTLGATTVAKSAPDGYTLILVSVGHAINATLYPKLGYDTVKDFAPVSLVASVPNVLVVNTASPYKSVRDIMASAKARPGAMNFDSAGSGSSTHLSGEMFKMQAGIDIVHIPYKGTGEALTDVMAGRGDMMFAPTVSAMRAPRCPSGFCGLVVESRAVWCSISALISPPSSTIVAEIQIQVMKPITAPSEP